MVTLVSGVYLLAMTLASLLGLGPRQVPAGEGADSAAFAILVMTILLGVLANAAVTGILSTPHDRYQARVIWLVPMAAMLVFLRRRAAEMPGQVDLQGMTHEDKSQAFGELPVRSAAKIAVLIPCYNEAQGIAKVVADFRAALPEAVIYVYDNNSTDGSVELARRAGALVRHEPRQGKGIVVRRMFADIEADIFVMVDGDDTYEAGAAPRMVNRLITEGLDVVNGVRIPASEGAHRPGHAFGNKMLSTMVGVLFGRGYRDMLSGYRVFSRRFVKSFPVMSKGFEIETELTIHALELQMPSGEEETAFKDRAAGSESKLNGFSDGFRILLTILRLVKQERPGEFFGGFAALFALLSLILAYPVIIEYSRTGLVPRLPTAVLAASIMLLAFLSIACGLILDTVTRGRQEAKRMRYLAVPGILQCAYEPMATGYRARGEASGSRPIPIGAPGLQPGLQGS